MASGAQAAYRGYRLQALYTLDRLVSTPGDRPFSFQPEAHEDLTVFEDGKITEVIQVKAHHDPLVLSSFDPGHEDSFFNRASKLLADHPTAKVIVATYGPIGPELTAACKAPGIERERVCRKLSEYGFLSVTEAEMVLNHVELHPVSESSITGNLEERIGHSIMGADRTATLDLLTYWLFTCAERRLTITPADLQRVFTSVGKYSTQRRAHHTEWFTSIKPVEDRVVESHERVELEKEFYAGIAARYEHILAGIDISRPHKLAEISAGFEQSRVVVVHGASGQGKSTLAYRYLHDVFPELWRFEVRSIEDRRHALDVALALLEHAQAIELPMAIYLDVQQGDDAWPELIRQLARQRNVRVLVTVREEDFVRARLPAFELQFQSVFLDLDKTEANDLFNTFASVGMVRQFLDFEDAWNRFGDRGPLLEFVHLLTQGSSLRERLELQVERLRDEVRIGKLHPSELAFLRVVAVAGAFGVRLAVMGLSREVGLLEPGRTLKLLEKEYLVRSTENARFVEGLHPVRSSILADLLTDQVMSPWINSAEICLHVCDERHLGVFLLSAFVQRPSDSVWLVPKLDGLNPSTWTGLRACTTALLWLGLRDYVESNFGLIQDVHSRVGEGWSTIIDVDITNAIPGSSDALIETLRTILPATATEEILSWRQRQTPKVNVFSRVSPWLASRRKPEPPGSVGDWAGLAESLFWFGYLKLDGELLDAARRVDLMAAVSSLTLRAAAELMSGIWECHHPQWDSCRQVLTERFRREAHVPELGDDGHTVTAKFIIRVDEEGQFSATASQDKVSDSFWHDEGMYRIDIMRNVWPDRDVYACKGFGVPQLGTMHDETVKHIPRRSLPLPWMASLNATFIGLVQYALRPVDWVEYSDRVVEGRSILLRIMRNLREQLEKYFEHGGPLSMKEPAWIEVWEAGDRFLKQSVLLPKCAVDPWGYSSEHRNRSGNRSPFDEATRFPALGRFKAWLSASREYFRTASNFFNQAPGSLVLQAISSSGTSKRQHLVSRRYGVEKGLDPRRVHLSVINLSDCRRALRPMQQEFRGNFSAWVNDAALSQLEDQESEECEALWQLWLFLAYRPQRRWPDARLGARVEVGALVASFHQRLENAFQKLSRHGCHTSVVTSGVAWDGQPALWIKVDASHVESSLLAFRRVYTKVRAVALGDDLVRIVYRTIYPVVGVIPTIKGQSLETGAWIMTMAELQYNEPTAWRMLKSVVPSSTWALLGTDVWPLSGLNAANSFLGKYTRFSLLQNHLGHMAELSEDADEVGREILKVYLEEVGPVIGRSLQEILDLFAEVVGKVALLPPEQLVARPNVMKFVQHAGECRTLFVPEDSEGGPFQMHVSLSDLQNWASRLVKAEPQLLALYGSWVAALLEGELQ